MTTVHMHKPALRRLVGPLLVVLLAFTGVGCTQEDSAPLASLQALPEAHLPVMPGATLIDERSSPRRWSIDSGWTGAYVARDLGVKTEPDTFASHQLVRDYYQSILQPMGWTDTCHVCGIWIKGEFVFDLGFQPVTRSSPEEWKPYSFVFYEALRQVLEEDRHLYSSATGSPGDG